MVVWIREEDGIQMGVCDASGADYLKWNNSKQKDFVKAMKT
jgi:hypothetical protein